MLSWVNLFVQITSIIHHHGRLLKRLQGLLEIEREIFCAGIVPFDLNLYTMRQAVPQWVVDVTPASHENVDIQTRGPIVL
jgi:hypothetical protein